MRVLYLFAGRMNGVSSWGPSPEKEWVSGCLGPAPASLQQCLCSRSLAHQPLVPPSPVTTASRPGSGLLSLPQGWPPATLPKLCSARKEVVSLSFSSRPQCKPVLRAAAPSMLLMLPGVGQGLAVRQTPVLDKSLPGTGCCPP